MTKILSLITAALLAAGLSACGGAAEGDEPTATKTVTVAAEPEADEHASHKPKAKPKPKPAAPAADTYTMPDLRGADLQYAQDTVQAVTDNPFFFTDSVDASGLGRFQVIDSGWVVCSQKPQPNGTFTDDTMVTFFVVKDGELCR